GQKPGATLALQTLEAAGCGLADRATIPSRHLLPEAALLRCRLSVAGRNDQEQFRVLISTRAELLGRKDGELMIRASRRIGMTLRRPSLAGLHGFASFECRSHSSGGRRPRR